MKHLKRYILITFLPLIGLCGDINTTNTVNQVTMGSIVPPAMMYTAKGVDYLLDSYVLNSWFTNWVSTNVFGVLVSASGGLTAVTNNGVVTIDGSSKWQNPIGATNWMWMSDGTQITLTNYNFTTGGASVVIPDMIDGLPVTALRTYCFQGVDPDYIGMQITSISGGRNLLHIYDDGEPWEGGTFLGCDKLGSVELHSLESVGNNTFLSCTSLTNVVVPRLRSALLATFDSCSALRTVSLPSLESTGMGLFNGCVLLESVSLPSIKRVSGDIILNSGVKVVEIGPDIESLNSAFAYSSNIRAVYFMGNAPSDADNVFEEVPANQVTNYIVSSTATGWTNFFGGRPVVRMGGHFDSVTINGDTRTNWPTIPSTVVTNITGVNGIGVSTSNGSVVIDGTQKVDTNDTRNLLFNNVTITNALYVESGTQTASIAMSPSNSVLTGTTRIQSLLLDGVDINQRMTNTYNSMAMLPYKDFTSDLVPVNGTATVTYASGYQPRLIVTNSPVVVTLDNSAYGTNGISRVNLSLYCGTNTIIFSTNVITYSSTPSLRTNDFNTILLRKVGTSGWKGIQLL